MGYETPKFGVVVLDAADAAGAQKTFRTLITASKKFPPQTEVLIFTGHAGMQAAVREIKNLLGVAIDRRLQNLEENNSWKIAKKVFEVVGIPVFALTSVHLKPSAMDQKILDGQWAQFEKEAAKYSPRGFRLHERQVLHMKVLLSNTPNRDSGQIHRSVTFDLSKGGCFVILFEEFEPAKELYLFFEDSAEPASCRLAWKLAWGNTKYHVPGIGLEFLKMPEEFKKTLHENLV